MVQQELFISEYAFKRGKYPVRLYLQLCMAVLHDYPCIRQYRPPDGDTCRGVDYPFLFFRCSVHCHAVHFGTGGGGT